MEGCAATLQKKEESENKEWIKLRGVTLDNGRDRHDGDNLNEQDRGDYAVYSIGSSGSKQRCHTDNSAEHDPR